MTIDRKNLACFVVAMQGPDGQWHGGILNEDNTWLGPVDADCAAAGEKAGVFCCNPSSDVRRAAAQALGFDAQAQVRVHRLFHRSDSDEAAAVLSGRVLH